MDQSHVVFSCTKRALEQASCQHGPYEHSSTLLAVVIVNSSTPFNLGAISETSSHLSFHIAVDADNTATDKVEQFSFFFF